MEVTLSGIVTLVNPLHEANIPMPMEVVMVTLVNPEQYWNAQMPMDVTLLGIVTLFNPVQ